MEWCAANDLNMQSYYEEPDGPYECLYDLENDPDELVNQANNPEYAIVRKQMIEKLDAYHALYPKVTRDTDPKK